MKKTTKITSVILAIIILLSTLSSVPLSAFAETKTGKCGKSATYSFNSSTGTFTISGTGAMDDYYWYELPWRSLKNSVKSVVINNGITTIGDYAFYEFEKMTSVKIPDSVTKINDGAFMGCEALANVTLPSKLTEIGEGAFYLCPFKSISLPSTLKTIKDSAFDYTGLTKITIPASVTFIGNSAFSACYSLKEIRFNAKNAYIYPSVDVMETDTVIYGYSGSTAQKYAQSYGRTFVDLQTNKKTVYKISNNDLVAQLPTNIKAAEPAMVNISIQDSNGIFEGYEASIMHESNTNNKNYKAIKAKTDEIISGKKTDYDKAVAIEKWVHSNMKYVFGDWSGNRIDSVYIMFGELQGNCMCFTVLTNYMLYLAGIPSAIINNYGHEYSAALVDGKWLMVDSTNGIVSYDFGDYYDIDNIAFSTPDYLTMVIDGKDGVALAGTRCFYENDPPKTITIPSYVSKIYENCLTFYDAIVTTIKGTKGSYAESWCKSNYTLTYSGNSFTAKFKAFDTPKLVSLTVGSSGPVIKWEKVWGASAYKVFRKTGNGSWQGLALLLDYEDSFTDWTAEKGKKYTYTVRCINRDYDTYTSDYDHTGLSVTYAAKPKLSSVSNTATGVKITWEKATGAVKYRVYYKTSSTSWTKLADTTSTSYTWTGAKSNTNYTFTVRCITSDGKSYASTYDATGKSIKYIAAPKISSVTKSSSNATIKWGAVSGAAKYRVFYKVNGESNWHKAGDTTGTSYTYKNVKSGKHYTFTVRCINSAGTAYTSSFDSTGKSIGSIGTPKLSSVTNTATGVQIKWGKVSGAVKYRVFYKVGNGSWKKITDTTSTSYVWKGTKSGTKYKFTVRCVSSDGNVYTSSYDKNGKTRTYIAAPKLSSLSKTSSAVTVKWGKVTGAEKYRVFYKVGNGSWKKIADTTSTSYTWKGAKKGTKYTFTVRCISKDGKSYTSSYNATGKSIVK